MINKTLAVLVAVCLVGSMVAVPGAVSAQTDNQTECSFLDGMMDNCSDEETGIISSYTSLVTNVFSFSQAAAQSQYADMFGDQDTKTASQIVNETEQTWNANSQERVDYTNDRLNQTTYTNETVIYEVTVNGADDTTETTYITFDVDENGTITATEAVGNVSGTPEESFVVEGTLAQKLNSEIENFDQKFVGNNETPTMSYFSTKSGEYCGDISGTHPAIERINDNPASAVFCG